jgi:hypothetical protein
MRDLMMLARWTSAPLPKLTQRGASATSLLRSQSTHPNAKHRRSRRRASSLKKGHVWRSISPNEAALFDRLSNGPQLAITGRTVLDMPIPRIVACVRLPG